MMRHILKYIVAVFLSFVSGRLLAQETAMITRLYDTFSENLVTLSVDFVMSDSRSRMAGEAQVKVQGDAYHVAGDGYEIYCDGESVWIVDPAAREVIIESASVGGPDAYATNPALLLSCLEDYFYVTSASGSRFTFTPKDKGSVESAEVTLTPEASLSNGIFRMTDGSSWTIKVNTMTTSPLQDRTAFRPSTRFDSSWIVTDLR